LQEAEPTAEGGSSAADQTASEIERLHLQIKRMRDRNSLKQKRMEQENHDKWQMLRGKFKDKALVSLSGLQTDK